MTAQCKGSTMFMNVTQRCTYDAYDDEGYCTVHALLIARQKLAELREQIQVLEMKVKGRNPDGTLIPAKPFHQ